MWFKLIYFELKLSAKEARRMGQLLYILLWKEKNYAISQTRALADLLKCFPEVIALLECRPLDPGPVPKVEFNFRVSTRRDCSWRQGETGGGPNGNAIFHAL